MIEPQRHGEINFDLVDRMFAMRGKKPIKAYAMEYAYSAAYSIASVADSITVSRSGGVGSGFGGGVSGLLFAAGGEDGEAGDGSDGESLVHV
jgi:hypothetical protein